ncbi:MAG: serine/threonine protein phosphatase [Candidatus Lambdaproteobacteria bacterium]|nr:serine/threonine protein phosphatase [Candidatus Lambdaproteobacteria bacterium]
MAIAIGDIHGCLAPLQRLIERLPPAAELVFLGDYIDRGPASAQVVQYLRRLSRERPCRFLRGNHEQLMLDAVASPANIGWWLQNGGSATLESYGERPTAWASGEDRGAFLQPHAAFYASLALYHEDAQTIYVHAGIDPDVPRLADQDPMTLLWIREKFFRRAERWQGKTVIFGHTPTLTMGLPMEQVFRSGRFIGIDTGCVYGGCLTAIDADSGVLYQEPAARRM